MVKGDRFNVVKAREGYEDLVRGETVPPFLETKNERRTTNAE
jgi:hypothetical protein